MSSRDTPDHDALLAEVADLRIRVQEAEDTLAAIRSGDVDAIVVHNDIYTLDSANAADNRLRKDVLAQMEDAVLAFDVDDHVIFMNAAAERLYGVLASDVLGRQAAALFSDRLAAEGSPAPEQASDEDRLRSIHVLRDGRQIHVESTSSPLSDSRGALLGRLCVIRDVSSRIAAEETLRQATLALASREREFATLVQNSPDIFSRFDRELRHQYVSPVVEAYTGKPASQFLGKTHAEVGIPAPLRQQWTAALRAVFDSGSARSIKFRFETVADGTRVFHTRLMPEFDDKGRVESVLSIASDVTDQELVDIALRESQSRLEFTLDSAKIGEWELDLVTDVARTSLRHDRCFGYELPVVLWGKAIMLSHIHPDDRARVAEMFDACERSHEDLHFECRVVWPDHTVHWIEAHGNFYGAAAAIRMLGIVVDTTDRKLAEAALVDGDRRKDEFIATLAHELRNPLAPIRTALQLMQRTPDPAQQVSARKVVERQVGQLIHLVDDLLDVSRFSQGKLELRREDVDVVDLIATAVETSQPLIDTAGHELVLRLPARDALYVHADVTRVCQAIANLLNNASKYTPSGGRIELSATGDEESVVIEVADSGVGIAPDMLPRVFDMFTQVDPDRAHGGLGIGLALVKRLIEMHGGSVDARSGGPGRGSSFAIRLPLVDRPAAAHVAAQDPHVALASDAGQRVLVADDNVDNAETLAELLSMLGYETRIAHDGKAAVQATLDFRPDFALLDIGMPRLDGHGAARQIRALPGGEKVVLIAVSGWGQDEDRRKSHEAGFDHHFAKPVDLDELALLLKSHAGRHAIL